MAAYNAAFSAAQLMSKLRDAPQNGELLQAAMDAREKSKALSDLTSELHLIAGEPISKLASRMNSRVWTYEDDPQRDPNDSYDRAEMISTMRADLGEPPFDASGSVG
jgi:hypothetical protein